MSDLYPEIQRIVNMIQEDEESVFVLSCGERIAAAFLFNRPDWLPDPYQHPLDAIQRLGENWLQMIVEYRMLNGPCETSKK